MLETLLFAYEDNFGEPFPLKKCEGMIEIDLINIIYYCIQEHEPYKEGMSVVSRVFGAPGQKK